MSPMILHRSRGKLLDYRGFARRFEVNPRAIVGAGLVDPHQARPPGWPSDQRLATRLQTLAVSSRRSKEKLVALTQEQREMRRQG